MKIRNGLVSNSSSSSFCIYGVEVTDKMQEKIKKFLGPKKNVEDDEDNEFISHSELDEMFNYNEKKFDVVYFCAFSGESGYLGRSWSSIKDNETGKQFKDSIEKTIESIVGEKVKCDTHDEAWNDC